METTLHNIIKRKKLKKLMILNNEKRITISFYKYFYIPYPKIFRDNLYLEFNKIKVFGRIYIANEGINAQISILEKNYDIIKNIIYKLQPRLKKVLMNIGIDDNGKSFWLLKIKVKDKILSDGITNYKFLNYKKKCIKLEAKEVNNMIEQKNIILIDMRNNYEYEIGHFEKALQVPANNFRQQLTKLLYFLKNKKNKKIVLYCTGGIRCEKSALWMYFNGFKNVYQINGGILEYVKNVRKNNLSMYFIGKIFVFDNRMAEKISKKIISNCYQCDISCDTHTNCKNQICHKLFIQCTDCNIKYKGHCSILCMYKK